MKTANLSGGVEIITLQQRIELSSDHFTVTRGNSDLYAVEVAPFSALRIAPAERRRVDEVEAELS